VAAHEENPISPSGWLSIIGISIFLNFLIMYSVSEFSSDSRHKKITTPESDFDVAFYQVLAPFDLSSIHFYLF
jgi:hypothetical protein